MKLNSIKYKTKSIRIRLFLILSITVLTIIVALILMNNIILKSFFLYSKEQTLLDVYNQINEFYKNPEDSEKMKNDLQKIAVNNNFDILIQKENYINVYTSNREFGLSNIEINKILEESNKENEVLYNKENVNIKSKASEKNNHFKFFKEMKAEVKRITWPSKDDTKKALIAVGVVVLIYLILVGGLDLIFTNLFKFIFNL